MVLRTASWRGLSASTILASSLLLALAVAPPCHAQADGLQDVHIRPRRASKTPSETGATSPAAPAPSEDKLTLRNPSRAYVKDVNLVLVPVTVTDAWNRLVMGLRAENFTLYEDGREQVIRHFSSEDSPISLCVIFDASKSMRNKIDKARQAVEQFVIGSNPQDEFCLISFSERPHLLIDFNQPPDALLDKLAQITPDGRTALLDAIFLGSSQMRHAHNPRRVLLVISDGGDNRSRYTAREITNLLMESDVQVFSIGIFDGWYLFSSPENAAGARLLHRLAEVSGGNSITLSDTKGLEDAAENLNLLMRNQYVLGYHPNNGSHDGKWRNIKVMLNPADRARPLHVTAKAGYYAPAN